MTEAPLTTCPECGAPATGVFYPVGIIFKGQGFYKTDSRESTTTESGDGKAATTAKEKTPADSKPSPATKHTASTKDATTPAPPSKPDTAKSEPSGGTS
jgi:predicted nucleic acid-binding Zn ribbon protein